MPYQYRPGKKSAASMPQEKLGVMYVRVSDPKQEEEGYSIPAQKRLLQDYADRNDIRVVQVFEETSTAKRSGRKQFQQMIEFLVANPRVKHILVEKTDRLYRNLLDHVRLWSHEPNLHLVKEGRVLNRQSKSQDKLAHNINLVLATHYSENLSEEVKKGLSEKALSGEFPGKAPAGYINDRNTRTMIVDPITAPMVRQAFELYATGRYSLLDIRKSLILMGFRTKGGLKPPKSSIELMLKNPIYYGDFRYQGKIYHGKHEPLISRELYEKVQHLLSRSKPGAYQAHQFAFVKFLTCAHCECSITAEIKKGKYIYYRCTYGKGRCQQKYVPEKKLAAQLGKVLEGLKLGDGFLKWVEAALFATEGDARKRREAEAQRLRSEIARLRGRLAKAYDDKLDGEVTEEFWREKSSEWQAQISEAQKQLAAIERSEAQQVETAKEVLELAQSAHILFLRQSPHEQRELLHHVLSNCLLRDGKVEPEYRKPFQLLAYAATEFANENADPGPDDPRSAFKWAQLDSNQ